MKRPSYAAITSTLALVVALSGGAYAVSSIPEESVGTKHLKDDAVTGKKIAPKTVAAADLAGSAKKVSGYTQERTTPNKVIPAGENAEAQAHCPTGTVAVGGGFWRSNTEVQIWWSYAIDDDTWSVSAYAPNGGEIVAHAICVKG